MELMHTQTDGEIVYTLLIERDSTPVRGNAMVSGNAADDKAYEDEILARLAAGDTWAWAQVTVQARHSDGRIGEGFLGGCCYPRHRRVHPDWRLLGRPESRGAQAPRLLLRCASGDAKRGAWPSHSSCWHWGACAA